MIKKIPVLFCVLFVALVSNSCFYIVSDEPYSYYDDYEDPQVATDYHYYYSYSYTNYPAVAVVAEPTPVPTAVVINQTNVNFIILKVVNNKHVFYRNNREIAVWYFHPDGRVERKGEKINGRVVRYYDDSDRIEWEFEYKDNLRWGHGKRYFSDGKICEEVYYNQGKREGPCKIYHSNSKIKEEVNYKSGNREGNYSIYHEDGRLIERGQYIANKKEVKYRDEKYFNNVNDERNNVVSKSPQQKNIQLTQTPDIKERQNEGLFMNKNRETDDSGNAKYGQNTIEKKNDAGRLTNDAGTAPEFLKTKMQKDKKRSVKYLSAKDEIKNKDADEEAGYRDLTGRVKEDSGIKVRIKKTKDNKSGKFKDKDADEEENYQSVTESSKEDLDKKFQDKFKVKKVKDNGDEKFDKNADEKVIYQGGTGEAKEDSGKNFNSSGQLIKTKVDKNVKGKDINAVENKHKKPENDYDNERNDDKNDE
jgi:hypothetical protein